MEDVNTAICKSGGVNILGYTVNMMGSLEIMSSMGLLYTQTYLILVVSLVLLPTSSTNFVNPRYIGSLYYIGQIHTFSWDYVVLAYLY